MMLLLAAMQGCGWFSSDDAPELVQAQSTVVESHTEGPVGGRDSLRVVLNPVLANKIREGQSEPPALDDVFTLTPSLSGATFWSGTNTLVFSPFENMPAGKSVTVQVALSKLPNAPQDADFSFAVDVRPQTMTLNTGGLLPVSAGVMAFDGAIVTGDAADPEAVERMLTVKHGSDKVEIVWEHPLSTRHNFKIRGIDRGEQDTQLILKVNGASIEVDETIERTFEVPAKGRFDVTQIRAVTQGSPHIEVRFSDVVDAGQDLRGLIQVSRVKKPRFEVNNESVSVFVGGNPSGSYTVDVQGVKSQAGKSLASPEQVTVLFGPQDPAVRFAGKGVILPRSNDLTIPIEAINLRGVWIEALAVPVGNLPQFLQVNDLDGSEQMRRVGRVVWRDHVEFDVEESDTNRWRRVGLDMAAFAEKNPAGMYQLRLRFLPQDSMYACSRPLPDVDYPSEEDVTNAPEQSFWDNWDGTSGYSSWELWDGMDNPCHPGFFLRGDGSKAQKRNIVVSNLGLMVKRGQADRAFVAATDLVSGRPVEGVNVELLDYQLQSVGKGTTDADGFVRVDTAREPFIATAVRGEDHAFVRLNDGGSLAMGHFDVGGVKVAEGLRGMIYGERGVWRPGDDIQLTFLRFDKTGALPSNHPVEFTLTDPQGKRVQRRTVVGGLDGFTRFVGSTAADAITGQYLVTARVGGSTFQKPLRVETIAPNRLKIGLDFGTERIDGPNPRLDSTLSARWLHGAPAPSMKATVDVEYRPKRTKFPKYEGYSFEDRSRSVSTSTRRIFEGRLNDRGEVGVQTGLELPDQTPGMLNAAFTTRVYEPSGRPSVDEITIPVSPYTRYVGLKTPKGDAARGMLLTDTDHVVNLAMVDAAGKPVAGQHAVKVTLYKVRWRWWWEAGDGDLADYSGRQGRSVVASGNTTLSNGKGTFTFQVKYPDWGRYLLVAEDLDGSHRASKVLYIDWPGWAGRAQKDNPGGATVLSVTSPQKEAQVGETVTLNIPAAPGGRALVSLETGTDVVEAFWVDTKDDMVKATFQATQAMVPNVYAHVTVVQPHQATKNDLPIRLYGVVPIEISSPETRLSPELVAADVFKPESTVEVTVKESDGKPMTYTLAMVDEGLLGLTRFKTPDPWRAFHQREALGVRSWDVYGYVAGALGGALEGVIAIGGDGEAEAPPGSKARRFPPVAKVMGPYRLDAGESKTHRINMPKYVGEVRLMVVAAKDGSFGSTEKSVAVRSPLMVLGTLPRLLGPQERLVVPVNVWALEPTVRNVSVRLEGSGPVKVVGQAQQSLRFSDIGEKMLEFEVETSGVGVANLKLIAEGNGKRSEQAIEIEVRPPGLTARRTIALADLAAGGSGSTTVEAFGLPGTRTAMLEFSSMPALGLEHRLDQLIAYPHGCAEQTTSRAFPQVHLKSLVDLSPERAAKVDDNVRAAITKLERYQTNEGGFSLWPSSRADDWTSSWVGHFLVEADRAGYRVPDHVTSAWIDYQKNAARNWTAVSRSWSVSSELGQAYRLYTLALAGTPEMGAMNRLKSRATLSAPARWRLAAAYALAGQAGAARTLVKGASTEAEGPVELGGTYSSPARERAMILDTLAALDPTSSSATTMLQAVATDLSNGQKRWATQTTAFALVSVAHHAQALGASKPISAQVKVGKRKAKKAKTTRPILQIPLELEGDGPVPVSFRNQGSGLIYGRLVVRALPAPSPSAAEIHGLEVNVSYVTEDGDTLLTSQTDHGMDFKAWVRVRNVSGRKLENVAVTAIFPSGWELFGMRSGTGDGYTYRDVRDDRVNYYLDLESGGQKMFPVGLNAAYRGRYFLPEVRAEAMYDASIWGGSASRWTEVAPTTGRLLGAN